VELGRADQDLQILACYPIRWPVDRAMTATSWSSSDSSGRRSAISSKSTLRS
jgi:hypothetical protein